MLLEKLIESRCLVLIPVSNVIDGNDFGRWGSLVISGGSANSVHLCFS
jgi:hypothetical protein